MYNEYQNPPVNNIRKSMSSTKLSSVQNNINLNETGDTTHIVENEESKSAFIDNNDNLISRVDQTSKHLSMLNQRHDTPEVIII